MFFITHEETGNSSTAVVEIDGPLNSETSSDFEEYTSKLADNGFIYQLINSEKINFISSEGIGAVLLLHRKISSAGGAVVFFGLSREISMLFHLLGFDQVLDTAGDRGAAIEMVSQLRSEGGRTVPPVSREARKSLRESNGYNEVQQSPEAEVSSEDHSSIRPFVIECVKCSSPVRVSMKGDHYCPYCSAPFTVSGEGNAIFRLNDIPSSND